MKSLKIFKLNALLGFPQSFPAIYITGTDGKGSTTNMLASILIESGYKVGTFTTPGIKNNTTNNIKVNGVDIPTDDYERLKRNVEIIIDKYNINSTHENLKWGTVMFLICLLYFKEQNIDIAIIEAVKGAKNCVTSVIYPIISAITNITGDHFNQYKTMEKYAVEKAGAIMPYTPCFIGETPEDESTRNMLIKTAKRNYSKLVFADKENSLIIKQLDEGKYETKLGVFELESKGDFQKYNLNLVLHIVEELKTLNYKIDEHNIKNGLLRMFKNTNFGGRYQILNNEPKVILDGCHTPGAFRKIMEQIQKNNKGKIHIIFSACKDKDVESMIKTLLDDENIIYYFFKSKYARLIDPNIAFDKTNNFEKSRRYICNSFDDALSFSLTNANKDDTVFIASTLLYVETLINYFKK